MTIDADRIKNSRNAFQCVLHALDAVAHAMAEAEAPNGEIAHQMHMGHARAALLEAIAHLDGRHRTVTLPALPRLPAPLTYEAR
jgi:hypothetical protein